MNMDFAVESIPFSEFIRRVVDDESSNQFESERARGMYHHVRYRKTSESALDAGNSIIRYEAARSHNTDVIEEVGFDAIRETLGFKPDEVKRQLAELDTISEEAQDDFFDYTGRTMAHLACLLDVFGLDGDQVTDFEHWERYLEENPDKTFCFQKRYTRILRALSGVGDMPNGEYLREFYGFTWAFLEETFREAIGAKSNEMYGMWADSYDPLSEYNTCRCDKGGE